MLAGTMPDFLAEGLERARLPEAVLRFFLAARVNFNVRQHLPEEATATTRPKWAPSWSGCSTSTAT